MDPYSLIPTPDSIPAPAGFFLVLEILLFIVHILLVNFIIGGCLLLVFYRFKSTDTDLSKVIYGPLVSKLPTSFALAINVGIAPLLFIQVIYGHLIYTSSILMAAFWLSVIPFLIIAYYSAYIQIRFYSIKEKISKIALILMSVIVLYIAFIYVNNMTLMVQPIKWTLYFSNKNGTILNLNEPTLIPRYLHFIVASVAIAALALAGYWSYQKTKNHPQAEDYFSRMLRIFGIATVVQVVVGFWFLLALPTDFIQQFMGKNMHFTGILLLGFITTILTLFFTYKNNLKLTIIHVLITMLLMVMTRSNLRSLYLQDYFSLDHLAIRPQYDILALFLIILVIGLISVGHMIRISFSSRNKEVNP